MAEWGLAVSTEGPKPASEAEVAELRATARGVLGKHYKHTVEVNSDVAWPEEPEYLDGPVLPLWAEYDEDGHGIGDPLPDKQLFHFAWYVNDALVGV